MANGLVKNYFPQVLYRSHNSSSASTSLTNGTIQGWQLDLIHIDGKVINVAMLELRIKDVSANVNPVITITDEAFRLLKGFSETFPTSLRGPSSGGSYPSASNGGLIDHNNGENTITITFFNYIAPMPAGYIHVVR